MKNTNCPYVKTNPDNNILSNFSLITRAEAQPIQNIPVERVAQSLSSQLSTPFYLLVASFFLFTFLMAAVYIYHWINFNLNDPIIKHFIPVFFVGLVMLLIPLIFNLIN